MSNIKDVLQNNNINIESILVNDSSAFMILPYEKVCNKLSEEQQLTLIKKNGSFDKAHSFLASLLKCPDPSLIYPSVFVEACFKTGSGFSNKILEIIKLIDAHPQSKEIILMLLDEYEDKHNEVSNILNAWDKNYRLLSKYFDIDIFNKVVDNLWIIMDEDFLKSLFEDNPEHEKLVKENAYRACEQTIKTFQTMMEIDEFQSWKMYSIPDQIFELLTVQEIYKLFALEGKYSEITETMFRRLTSCNIIEVEDAQTLANLYDLSLPSHYIAKIQRNDLKINIEDPYSHMIDGTFLLFNGTDLKEDLLSELKKIEHLEKDVANLPHLLVAVAPHNLSKDELEVIFSNKEYIKQIYSTYNHHYNIYTLLGCYLELTDNKREAFEVVKYLIPNKYNFFQVLRNIVHQDPEYVEILCSEIQDKELITEIILNMIEYNVKTIVENI